jgi:tetratricopeptide (TPR) repeat protein
MTSRPHTVGDGSGAAEACLDPRLLASYIDGQVTPEEGARVEAHLARCNDCYFVFSETFQASDAEAAVATAAAVTPRRWGFQIDRRVAAGLAAAATIVVALQVYRSDTRQERNLSVALSQLEAVAGPYRQFAPRLSDGDTYKPQVTRLRSASPADAAPLALREAALKVETAAKSGTLGAQERARALAVMYLTLGNAKNAADVVPPAVQSVTDAALLNDMAAALLARGGEGDAARALQLLDEAVAREPNRAEAWFNLGLAAEAAGNRARAQEAWQRYLSLDSSSPWAGEVRGYLDGLRSTAEPNRPQPVTRESPNK